MSWRNVVRTATNGRTPSGIFRMTEAQFEALTEYDWDAIYRVDGVGVYHGPELIEAEALSAAVGDLYVATTGDDGEDGTDPEAPKLTIESAFNSISTSNTAPITIWVDAGTYTEDWSGGYMLFTNKAFAHMVTIRGRPGTLPVVVSSSGAYTIRPNGTSGHVRFRNLELRTIAASSGVVHFDSTALSNFEVVECLISDANSRPTAITINGTAQSAVAIKRCTFTSAAAFSTTLNSITGGLFIGNTYTGTLAGQINATAGSTKINSNVTIGGIQVAGHATIATALEIKGNTCRNIAHTGGATGNRSLLTISRNVIDAGVGVRGIAISGYTSGGMCTHNTVVSLGDTGLGWPIDGGTSVCDGHAIRSNTVTNHGTGGHGILVSTGGLNAIVSHNTTNCGAGGSYGCVIKGTNNIVRNNTFIGGSLNGALLKDCDGIQFLNNVVTSDGVSAVALRFDNAATCTVTGNTFNVTDGTLHSFTESTNESNVVDSNTYLIGVDATWGTMFGNAVNSLADVQAQWLANYETGPTNDANSVDA